MARLAEEAGFKALYLSGGSLGWQKCVTEANLTLPEMAQVAVEMRTVCKLPIVLDAGGGFGIVNTPAYRKLNPNGLVPTLVDDG